MSRGQPPIPPTNRPVPPRAGKHDRTVIDAGASPFDDQESTQSQVIQLEPGLRIEHYELIRELGRGGMGQVFLARDTKLGRRVAMKFLATSSPRFTKRFLAEAKVTAAVSHENIVTIYDSNELLGMPYMVLEYVEGTTLRELMGDKRMPAARAVELMVPVVKALVAAHEANIVHRDLKPENIIVTTAGTVKVLDFGVAKLFSDPDKTPTPARQRTHSDSDNPYNTRSGAIVGTLPYMSPEQLGTDTVDHRSDLWAIGIILYELIAAKHPLAPVTQGRLFGAAAAVDEPMPSLEGDVAGVPDRLVEIVARCLAKQKHARYGTARELHADLEPLLPVRTGRSLVADESPYPGLTAFQESDANRFFGRYREIGEATARLRDRPLVGIVGPSGVGKSSFVRAGVVPALKISGDPWDCIILRPGRHPMAALASTLESLRDTRDSDPAMPEDPIEYLWREPGQFGTRLRARARRKRCQILVFVDQFEELYTLVPDPAERLAFTACLLSAGDDPASPLRVVVSMRSDFLDRAAEDRRFLDELTRGLVFLQPPDRAGLEEALIHPVEMLGYKFEPGIVHAMLSTLEATPGPLPLLQFSAAKLWAHRDRQRLVLTHEAYLAMGGVAGALATHADEVLARLASDQRIVRAIFLRLVTPERTRAIVDRRELRDIAPDVDRVIGHLVEARLLVVQTRGESEGAVELVHESLIKSWPTLRRWLDENQEHAAYLAHIAVAARQWDTKGRPQGLLWTGEAMQEARIFRARYTGELPARERDFLDAVDALARRTARRRRIAAYSVIGTLLVLLAATASVALYVREQQQAAEQARTTIAAQLAELQQTRESERLAREAMERATRERLEAERAKARQQEELQTVEAELTKQTQTADARKQALLEQKRLAMQQIAEQERRARKAAAEAAAAKSKLDATRAKEAEKAKQISDKL